MCVLCHTIRLIEDDDFEWWAGVFFSIGGVEAAWLRELGACEVFDLFTDDVDASFVGGVEFEDAGAVEGWAEEGFCEGEDGGCFASSGGPVEKHVWELSTFSSLVFAKVSFSI